MKLNKNELLKILTAYQRVTYKINRVYFRSEVDRENNLQETIYQLWQFFSTLRNKEKPVSWIHRVVINISTSKIGKDSHIEFHNSPLGGETVDSWEQQKQDENWQRLANVLQKLNEVDKSIILLYMEDYSYKEIAEIAGMSGSTVGAKIHRLRSRLQKQSKK